MKDVMLAYIYVTYFNFSVRICLLSIGRERNTVDHILYEGPYCVWILIVNMHVHGMIQ